MRKMISFIGIIYPKWKRSHHYFGNEPLVLILELETSNVEEERGQINSVRPSNTRTLEEELVDLKGGKDNSHKKTRGMKYVLEQNVQPL